MQIDLDGRDWLTEAEFIEAVLGAVEAPSWHGRNYNALRDSFVGGSVNGIDPPYDFIIRMPPAANPKMVEAVHYFVARISDWQAEGAQLSARLA
jgi:hypothetical protein